VFLSGFGLFFTFLGVLLLFDRGFLAIGNVCASSDFQHLNHQTKTIFFTPLSRSKLTRKNNFFPCPAGLPCGRLSHNWNPQNLSILLPKAKAQGFNPIPGWNRAGVAWANLHWARHRNFWFRQSLRVRLLLFLT
jgi:hypothetical protein